MKGNSNTQPNTAERLGDITQVRWNVTRNDRKNEDGELVESWDYNYANCVGNSYSEKVEGIIRSRYSADEVEAVLANNADKKKVLDYLKFQAWRNMAKQVANGEDPSKQVKIQAKMPLSFVLSGGKYEVLADRILKLGCPSQLDIVNNVEYVSVWLNYIEDAYLPTIQSDEEIELSTFNLLE